jgi:tetratricopeptide (TPR) repeat protein
VDAYDTYLRARGALLARGEEENERARSLFRQAIWKDPAFSHAYGGLALVHAADYRNQWTQDGDAALDRALELALTSLEMEPSLPEAHWVLAYVYAQRKRHEEAIGHLDEALKLAPSFADAYALKGGVKTYLGEPGASVPLLREAMRLNPGASHLYYLLLGCAHFFLGDLEQASINLREAISRNPASLEAHVYLAAVLEEGEDRDAAQWEAEEIRAIEPKFSTATWLRTYPMVAADQTDRLELVLSGLGL